MVGSRAVSHTGNLEVPLSKITIGDRFVEIQADFILYRENTIGRLSGTEEARVIHIFYTGSNFRIVVYQISANITDSYSA